MIKQIIRKAVALVERPVKHTNWYRNQSLDSDNYPTNEWYRSHDERNFDIVNVGSSNALYAFDYSTTGLKAFNWALQPQSMEYGFKVLKNFFSILRPKGIVTIPLCPFSGLSVPFRKWAQSTVDRYYDILDPSLIDDYSNVAYRHVHPLLSNPVEALKRLVKDVPANPSPKDCNTDEEFRNDALRWIEIWKNEFAIDNLSDSVPEHNIEGMGKRQKLVSEIIAFCKERDLVPVIVIPPVHETLARYFDSSFRKHYIGDFLNGIDLGDIRCIDWLNPTDCPFRLTSSDFINSFFLNKSGAKKFTAAYIKQLDGLL